MIVNLALVLSLPLVHMCQAPVLVGQNTADFSTTASLNTPDSAQKLIKPFTN